MPGQPRRDAAPLLSQSSLPRETGPECRARDATHVPVLRRRMVITETGLFCGTRATGPSRWPGSVRRAEHAEHVATADAPHVGANRGIVQGTFSDQFAPWLLLSSEMHGAAPPATSP